MQSRLRVRRICGMDSGLDLTHYDEMMPKVQDQESDNQQ